MFGKESKKDSKKDANQSNAVSEPTTESSPTPPASPNQFQSRSTAMIGQSIQIKGTITGAENLVVEGSVEGSIDLPDNDLTIGETGQVTAVDQLSSNMLGLIAQMTGIPIRHRCVGATIYVDLATRYTFIVLHIHRATDFVGCG